MGERQGEGGGQTLNPKPDTVLKHGRPGLVLTTSFTLVQKKKNKESSEEEDSSSADEKRQAKKKDKKKDKVRVRLSSETSGSPSLTLYSLTGTETMALVGCPV